MRSTLFPIALGTLIASGPALAASGVTVVTERTGEGESSTATIRADAEHVRVDMTGKDGGRVMIFDVATKTMYAIDTTKKTYMQMDAEDAARARSMLKNPAVEAAMKERLAQLPPEQRARVEAMMARQGGAPGAQAGQAQPQRQLKFDKTGENKTVNGFACEGYKVSSDGKPWEEDCLAAWSAATLQRDDFAAFKKMGEMFRSDGPEAAHRQNESYEHYPGFPVVRTMLRPDGSKGSTQTLKSVSHGNLAADLFQVPAGFTRKTGRLGAGGPPAGAH